LLRYFRINDPYRLIGLLVIAAILFIPPIIDSPPVSIPELRSILIGERISHGAVPYVDIIDPTAPLAMWFYGLIDALFGESLLARHLVAFLVIISQGVYIGLIFINRKVFSESTYIPALLFIIFCAVSYDSLALSGELIGSGFLLLALNNLFKELEFRTKSDDTVLALGAYISLASLSGFAYWVYFLAAGTIVVVYSRRDLRIFLLLLTGFVLPHLLLASFYFMTDNLESLLQYYYLPNLRFGSPALMSLQGLLYLSLIPILYAVVSVLIMNREARFSKYQSQIFQSMLLWTVFSVVQIAFARDLRAQSLITAVPCLCYFVGHLLLLIRRRRFAEWSLWILMLGVVMLGTLARHNKLTGINYGRLQVERERNWELTGKRIVVLDDNLSYYLDNALATPFVDWDLVRPVFSSVDYYRNVILINEGFRDDYPDVIIDPGQTMPGVFDRIPHLAKMYREEERGRYVKAN